MLKWIFERWYRALVDDEERLSKISVVLLNNAEVDKLRLLKVDDTVFFDGISRRVQQKDEFGENQQYLEFELDDGTKLTIRRDSHNHIRHYRQAPFGFWFFRGTKGKPIPFKTLEVPSVGLRVVWKTP